MPKRFVYVIRSQFDPRRTYIGLSADPRKRIAAHNTGLSPSTAPYKPWEPVVIIEFVTEKRAFDFERYLKSGSGRAFSARHFE